MPLAWRGPGINDFVFVDRETYNRIREATEDVDWDETMDRAKLYTATADPMRDTYKMNAPNYSTQSDSNASYTSYNTFDIENGNTVQYKWVTGQCEVPINKERKVVVKLTLKEATYLEKRAEEDPKLKDILAKIEEQVDFELKVSFLTAEEE